MRSLIKKLLKEELGVPKGIYENYGWKANTQIGNSKRSPRNNLTN